jgi:hypothetical protein
MGAASTKQESRNEGFSTNTRSVTGVSPTLSNKTHKLEARPTQLEINSDAEFPARHEVATGTTLKTHKLEAASAVKRKSEADSESPTPREFVQVVEETDGPETSTTHLPPDGQDPSLNYIPAGKSSPAIDTLHIHAQGATFTEIKTTNYYMGQGML